MSETAPTAEPSGGGRGKALLQWLVRGSRGRRPCPHCRSRLPYGFGGDACPQCGRALEATGGETLRPIDVDYEGKVRDLDARAWGRTGKGALIAAALAAAGYVPGLSIIGAPVIFFFQIIWVRMAIVAPYRAHFTGVRRFITRWLSRLALIPAASLHIGLAQLPGVNLIAVPGLFAALCAAAWVYHRWHLGRERERKPVGLLEKIVLWVVALVVVVCLALVLIFGAAFASLLEYLGA